MVINNLMRFIVEKSTWFYFKYLCQGEINGEENLPSQPYVLVANHVSYLDWMILYVFFRRRNKAIVFIAKKRLFDNFFFRYLMKHSKSICVDQEHVSKYMLRSALNVIKNNETLGIFPEGKRSGNGKLLKAYPGAIKIALLARVPIVPVGLNGFYEALPKGKKIPRASKCLVNIGKPIYFDKNEKGKYTKDVDEITKEVMGEIAKLTNQVYIY